jgi:hypothetical protein
MLERHVDPSHPYQREVRWGLPSSTGDDGILVMQTPHLEAVDGGDALGSAGGSHVEGVGGFSRRCVKNQEYLLLWCQ